MRPTTGLALLPGRTELAPTAIDRRDLRPDDVAIEVLYCGVCASDLHAIEHAAVDSPPLVPGHEFTGRVTAVGTSVARFSPGDMVAVGNIVDSCRECEECLAGLENYCRRFPTSTYGATDRHDGRTQFGGYAAEYVASERFVYPLPPTLDAAAAAPLMCAGITVWEPLQHWRVGAGTEVGVVGLGGLGHLAVRFAVALGARVTVFTTSPGKLDAATGLGADSVVVSSDRDAMRARARTLDLIVDTGAGPHDPSPYLETLRVNGTMCVLGVPERIDVASFSLRWGRHSLAGSGTGSPHSTARMLAFAAEHGIVADIELLPATEHAQALRRLAVHDVRWRFVLDMRALPALAMAESPTSADT